MKVTALISSYPKFFLCLLVVMIASCSSFIVHVITVEWLPAWIGQQMQGLSVTPSWDVRYLAMITSIEYGLATFIFYHLVRDKLIARGKLFASVLMFLLLAAIHGALVRQPLMDFFVGNPLLVVVVQNGFKYLVWMMMAFVTVFGYEFVSPNTDKELALVK